MKTFRVLGFALVAMGMAGLGLDLTAQSEETWWSVRPLVKPSVPSVRNVAWPRTPIDFFVLAKLEEKKLAPALEADQRTLLRRLCFDLTGLPPTPEQITEFLSDDSAEAYERLVDRLLASPQYGERWARHWLDVAHYADTHGHDQDRPRANAWPYRDYVVRSFNMDKPYAQFVQEQIAGDVLFPDNPDGVIATGFIATGPWDESSQMHIMADTVDKKIAQNLDRDDMVMTAMSTFVSTTVHCARCHDHKFDPITQEEYYGLQAVFAGVDRADRPFDLDSRIHQKRQSLLKRKTLLDIRQKSLASLSLEPELEQSIARGQAAWESRVQPEDAIHPEFRPGGLGLIPESILKIAQLTASERSAEQREELARFYRSISEELERAIAQINQQLAALPPPKLVYAAANDFEPKGKFTPAKVPRPIAVLRRGEVTRPADPAPPGALSLIAELNWRFELPQSYDEGLRRASLARWTTDSKNVLAWRSIVNRVWHYHFGRGLVDTPNDFGRMGSLPSHPELLDWLAATFLEMDGSFKRLHKLIVTSAVYRQSSKHHPEFAKVDSGNVYLWRMNRTRLDAESLRDAILAITGKIDYSMGGPSVMQFHFEDPDPGVTPKVDYARFDVDSPASFRRSIYRWIFRTLPDPFMDAMDCPDSSQLAPARNSSVTALQALSMLNNRFMVRQSEHFAERVASRTGDVSDQIRYAFQLALGREPSHQELADLKPYAETHGMANVCRLLLNTNEFLFVN